VRRGLSASSKHVVNTRPSPWPVPDEPARTSVAGEASRTICAKVPKDVSEQAPPSGSCVGHKAITRPIRTQRTRSGLSMSTRRIVSEPSSLPLYEASRRGEAKSCRR